MRMSSACRFSPASRPAVWSPWSSSRGTWNPLCTKTMRILNYFLSMQNVKHLLKSDRFFTAILVSKMWQITRLQYIIIFFYLSRIVQCCGSDFSKIRIYSIDPGPNMYYYSGRVSGYDLLHILVRCVPVCFFRMRILDPTAFLINLLNW